MLQYCLNDFFLATFGFLLISTTLQPGVLGKPTECNGLSNLCDVKVTDAYFGMVHNAMAAVENGFTVAANHRKDPIIESLDVGYRGLNIDLCNCDGQLQLCHGNDVVKCGLGRVDPVQALTEISEWISNNPNNVILISVQINEEAGGPISLEDVQSLVNGIPNGFSNRTYDHWPLGTEWPTLGELIERNEQILFFYFKGPRGNGEHLRGINYWYHSVVATDFSWDSVDDLQANLYVNCPITRGVSESTGDFFMIEAYVTESIFGIQFQPSRRSSQTINTVEWAGRALDACEFVHGFPATIFMVDFWSEGDLPTLIQQRNALLQGSNVTETLPPIVDSPDTAAPNPVPTFGPSIESLTQSPSTTSAIPTMQPNSASTLSPTSANPIDAPIATTSPTTNSTEYQSPTAPVCTLELENGEIVTVKEGDSFGEYLLNRCGPPSEFPCYCNTNLPGQIECPYCSFIASEEGALYCARNDESISFMDGAVNKTCFCQIQENPLDPPVQNCIEEFEEGADDEEEEVSARLSPSPTTPLLDSSTAPSEAPIADSLSVNSVETQESSAFSSRKEISMALYGSLLLSISFLRSSIV